jgi:DNA invertase Pin-like site-specific DNA recombinase
VIVYRINHFGRNMSETAAAVARLKKAGARLVSVDEGYDSDKPSGQILLGIYAGLAEQQLDERTQNWKTSSGEAVAEGKHIASKAPIGYHRRDQALPTLNDKGKFVKDARLVVNPDTSPVVRAAFEMRARGDSLKTIAEHLRDGLGRPKLAKSSASSILKNRVYLGEARGPNGAVNATAHEPVVTPELWEAAQRRERDGKPKRRSIRDGSLASKTMLAGIITCASCGRKLQVMGRTNNTNGQRMASYVCTAKYNGYDCDAPAIGDAVSVDQWALSILAEDSSGAAVGAGNADALYIQARERVNEAQANLDALIENRGENSVDVWTRMVAGLERELADARSEMWSHEDPGLPDDATIVTIDGKPYVYNVFGDDPEADRRALRKLIGSVSLAKCDPKRRRWQPISERIELRWARRFGATHRPEPQDGPRPSRGVDSPHGSNPHLLPNHRHRPFSRLLRGSGLPGGWPVADQRRGRERLHEPARRRRHASPGADVQLRRRLLRAGHRLRAHRDHDR